MQITKATGLELKLVQIKRDLNEVIDSISRNRDASQLQSLTDCLTETINLFKEEAGFERCDDCRELFNKDDLTLETWNYLSLCSGCLKSDDVALPSNSFFGVR